MYTKKSSWWSSLKKWFTGLYLVAFAFVFVAAGVVLLLFSLLNNKGWQTIGGALFVTGLSMLVASITTRQSSFEQYKKDANLQRKTDVYGPLHAELKVLREIFDKAHTGTAPYPRWIEAPGTERPSSLRYSPIAQLPAFSYWPAFKTDYRIDNFSSEAQRLLNEVQNLTVAYGEAIEAARKTVQSMLRPQIAASITKEEKSLGYQAWLPKRASNTEYNRWYTFIYDQRTYVAPTMPLGEGLSFIWSVKIGWLLADKPAQAAAEIFHGDAQNWDASQHSSLSWFQDIFETAASELKNDPTYQKAQDTQQALYTKLLAAEQLLYQALLYIRDHYEGGPPLV
jgi:hypothetical protein